MSGPFDPYHKWLGIPAAEQPAHLYRLLGLAPFETDLEVINEAADRLMGYVRLQQNGPYARESQQILNEISTARLTLTNPAKRAAYDAQLRQQIAARTAPPPVTMPYGGAAPPINGWAPAPPMMAPSPLQPAPQRMAPAPAPITMPGYQAPGFIQQPAPQPPPQHAPVVVAPIVVQHGSDASAGEPSVSTRVRGGTPPWMMGVAGVAVLAVILGGLYLVGNRTGGARRLAGDGSHGGAQNGTGPEVGGVPVAGGGSGSGSGGSESTAIPTTPVNIKTSGKKLTGQRMTTRSGKIARPAPPPGGSAKVDLLDVIDLNKHAQRGGWSFVEGLLITPPVGLGRLRIPAAPPEEYQISLIAERVNGEGALNLVLASGDVQFALLLDARQGRVSGLQLVDDRTVMGNATTHDGSVFVNNLPVRVTCTVRKSGVKVICDDKTIVNFGGELKRLSMDSDWQERDKQALFLGSSDAGFVISQLVLTPADLLPEETEAEQTAPPTPLPTAAPPDEAPRGRSLADLVGQIQHEPTAYGFSSKPVSPDDAPLPAGQPNQFVPPVPTGPKQPLPPEDELRTARRDVRESLRDRLGTAKKPNEKLSLARTVLGEARDRQKSPAERCALFDLAQELAGEAGDVPTAWQAIDTQAAEFEIPFVAAKRDALATAARMARSPAELKFVSEAYIYLVMEAVRRDEYPLALDLADKSVDAARRAKDLPLVDWVVDRTRDLKTLAEAYGPAKAAQTVLKLDAKDGSASQIYGDFLALHKRQWKPGLELWANTFDPVRKQLAEAESNAPTAEAARLALADQWWDFSQTLKGLPANAARVRAGRWYRLVTVTGPDQARVSERMAEASLLELGMTKGEWLDVLRLVDVQGHRVAGTWERKGPEVSLRGAREPDRLGIPIAVSGVYELQIRFTPMSANGSLCLVLPMGRGQCLASVAGNGANKLEPGGLPVIDNNGQKLARGTMHTLEARVDAASSQARVQLEVNGQVAARWQGALDTVLPITAWSLQQPGLIGLGGSDSANVTLHSVRLRLVNGQVWYWGKWSE